MKNLHKQIILAAVVVVLGIFSWWFLKYVFYIGNLSLGCWISGIILLIVFGIGLALAMLLIDNRIVLYSSFAILLILFFIFFNNQPGSYLAVLILLMLVFAFAAERVRKEEENQIKLNYWKIWKKGLPIFFTVFVLLVAVIFYFSPNLMEMKQIEIKMPKDVFDSVLGPIENLLGTRLSKLIGLDTDTIYKEVNYQINDKLNPYKKFIPISLALGLFVGLKVVSLAYVALIILFSFLVVKLLALIGFIKTEKIKKEAETVKL